MYVCMYVYIYKCNVCRRELFTVCFEIQHIAHDGVIKDGKRS